MKGIVFTEFLEMVERDFSPDLLDRIIRESDLPNDGAYTAVGTYDHREMLRLVARLSAATEVPAPALLLSFGRSLFQRFTQIFPQFFGAGTDALDFLQGIESYIHQEVRKFYPDAELPRFDCQRPAPQRLDIEYHSARALADLAEGLIRGCIAHFAAPVDLCREDLPGPPGTHVRFTLVRRETA